VLRLFRLPLALGRRAALLVIPLGLAAHRCESCHPKEVAGYSHSNMSRSLRRAGNEPQGAVGTTFRIHSDGKSTWQRMERDGKSAEYRIAYVIGSGSHASGYLIQAGGHLFQSPLCYYTNQGSYGLAPGYEHLPAADFTRAVDTECLVCHSGKPTAGGSVRKRSPAIVATERRHSTCGDPYRGRSSIRRNYHRRLATVPASSAIWLASPVF
jgi:hypothetical protein